MSFKEDAASFDARDQPVEAAQAYEMAIASSEADLDTYINLAVLYFVCNDGGYAAHHKLSQSFLSVAWDRAFELLDEAELRFGEHPETSFWKLYFSFVLLGADPSFNACEQLTHGSRTLVPYFHLFSSPEGERYRQPAEKLLQLVSAGATAKERYIKSVLESTFRRRNQAQH
ncbi:hypothetical protein [Kallotenue papyrolyticum]|uniref:hypothetical protein n=1 Tax=Kallotenue papyrolyticum TaxID=1325125 RepID=UPI0012689E7D|nr:hypothetical protein [Kallotenue papyrolyticum]